MQSWLVRLKNHAVLPSVLHACFGACQTFGTRFKTLFGYKRPERVPQRTKRVATAQWPEKRLQCSGLSVPFSSRVFATTSTFAMERPAPRATSMISAAALRSRSRPNEGHPQPAPAVLTAPPGLPAPAEAQNIPSS